MASASAEKQVAFQFKTILCFGLSVFTFLALISYHATDASFFSTHSSEVLPKNFCGRVGAEFSSLFLNYFGVGAFLVPAAFFVLTYHFYRRSSGTRVLGAISGMVICVVSFTTFLALKWRFWNYGGSQLLIGGVFGAWVSDGLIARFNPLGSFLVACILFALSLAWSTPWDVVSLASRSFRLGLKIAYYSLKFFFSWAVLGLSCLWIWRKRKRFQRTGKVSPQQVRCVEPVLALEQEEVIEESVTFKILPRDPVSHSQVVTPQKKQGQWHLPSVDFLKDAPVLESSWDRDRLLVNSQILKQKFLDFGIQGEVTAARPGPVITLYEFKPGPGVKVSRIAALVDDLSMALAAQSVRILAPLPGKSVVGIEIPSEVRETVYLKEFLQHPDFYGSKHAIPMVMGKEIGGQTYLSDLARMPHLLCAGQTGSGKSVFMNGLICSLLYRFTPDELRMILVDPKFIEFRSYQDIPHLLLPVVDDAKQASIALKWAVREMERRYRILAKVGVRNLMSFNQKVDELGCSAMHDLLHTQDAVTTSTQGSDWIEAFEPDEKGVARVDKLPFIVVIIDELADLMMIAKKEVEVSIARIAQKARAAGIHLIIATQRPSTDVITGLIKANLPTRVSFQLASFVDSKTILDRAGAERLLGQGDMLLIPPGSSQLLRLHGAFLEDAEINRVTDFWRLEGKPVYRNEILIEDEDTLPLEDMEDVLWEEALEIVKQSGHASASFLQRQLKIGYNRAARMIETMEARGLVGPQDGARPREVLMR